MVMYTLHKLLKGEGETRRGGRRVLNFSHRKNQKETKKKEMKSL